MNSRGPIVGGHAASTSPGDACNVPIDLVQKTPARAIDSSVGNATKTSTAVFPSSGHVFTTSNFSKTGGSSNTALNLAASNTGTIMCSAVPSATNAPPAHQGYFIPRSATPRHQAVSAPPVRAITQSQGLPGVQSIVSKPSLVSSRVVPGSGWNRSATSTLTKSLPSATSLTPVRCTSAVTRPPASASSITYSGIRPSTLRTPNTTAVRNKLLSDVSRSNPKPVNLSSCNTQLAKKCASGGTSVSFTKTTMSSASVTLGSYGNSNVTSVPVSSAVVTSSQSIRGHSAQTISVKITTASLHTPVSSQVPSQTGTVLPLPLSVSTSPGAGVLNHHTVLQKGTDHHIAIKTNISRAAPVSHQVNKSVVVQPASLSISSAPKVITQPAQGSSLAITQIPSFPHKLHVGAQQAGISTRPASVVTTLSNRVGCSTVVSASKGTAPSAVCVNNDSASVVHHQPLVSSHLQVPAHCVVHSTLPSTVVHTQSSTSVHSTGILFHRAGDRAGSIHPQYTVQTPYAYDPAHTSAYSGPASLPSSGHFNVNSNLRVTTVNSGILSTNQPVEVTPVTQQTPSVTSVKPNSSPRPSILRKRPDADSGSFKAVKNLTATLSFTSSSPPSPKKVEASANGSSGSGTMSSDSSPVLQIDDPESAAIITKVPALVLKQEPSDQPMATNLSQKKYESVSFCGTLNVPQLHLVDSVKTNLGPDGYSPRKKPRKQQLMGNELHEGRSGDDCFEQLNLHYVKTELDEDTPDVDMSDDDIADGASDKRETHLRAATASPVITRPPPMSLLKNHRRNWKSRQGHFVKYTDIKPKEEKKHTVIEIASHKMALQRINGWKVFHLSGQVEDLVTRESEVVEHLETFLSYLEKKMILRKPYKDYEKDTDKLSELLKANIQRSKIIRDQMDDAKGQMGRLVHHKTRISEIMVKYGNKRTNGRKREKT